MFLLPSVTVIGDPPQEEIKVVEKKIGELVSQNRHWEFVSRKVLRAENVTLSDFHWDGRSILEGCIGQLVLMGKMWQEIFQLVTHSGHPHKYSQPERKWQINVALSLTHVGQFLRVCKHEAAKLRQTCSDLKCAIITIVWTLSSLCYSGSLLVCRCARYIISEIDVSCISLLSHHFTKWQ